MTTKAAANTQSIWKEMGEDRRKQAAEAFYGDDNLKDFQRAAELFIARNKNFRPQFVKKLPLEKSASYLAHLPIPPDMMGQLIVSYHFAYQKPLMSAFLNALEIPNEDGVITDSAEVKAPEKAALEAAVAKVKSDFPAEDVSIYFETLQAQDGTTWGALADIA